MATNNTNYYGGELNTIEKVVLAEDLTFSDFKEITGKFFIDQLHPNNGMKSDKPRTINRGSYQKSNYIEIVIPPTVLINLVRPKIRTLYIDANGYVNIHNGRPIRLFGMGFKKSDSTAYKIPKGTEFLMETIQASTSVEDYRIIGTSESNPNVKEV